MRVMIQLMLVFALVLGQIPISVFAQTAVTENVLATGSYTIEQDVLKSDSDEVSSAGKFLQTESTLEVTEAGMLQTGEEAPSLDGSKVTLPAYSVELIQ